MYWQKRFNRENPDEALEREILDIRKENKDFGYRRIHGELTSNRNIRVNKKESSENRSKAWFAGNFVYSQK